MTLSPTHKKSEKKEIRFNYKCNMIYNIGLVLCDINKRTSYCNIGPKECFK